MLILIDEHVEQYRKNNLTSLQSVQGKEITAPL